jgi:DNA-binding NarL/FixJ family response regulator
VEWGPSDRGVIGREGELAIVQALLAGVDEGGRALLLEGEAGIGKSTVWLAAVEQAREAGYQVLACRTAQTEVSLPFVALGDLLESVVDDALAGLPAPQRLALESALARVPPREAFGRLAVSRAMLSLLREWVPGSRLLIAIDDVQWLDAPTRAALEFALRRLAGAPIRVLISHRSGAGPDPAVMLGAMPCERVSLGPLSIEELGRLIAGRWPQALSRRRLAELHRTTNGNPYFAVEIVRGLRARGVPLAPDAPFPIPDDIAAVLRERIAQLSSMAVEVLVLAAACPQPTATLLAAVTGSTAGVSEAVAAGILEHDGERLRFAHPLLASVLYGDVDAASRREVHGRLAAAVRHPEDRALHLARATEEPDPTVAAELDAAAGRASRRGAPATASELEQHACRLTPTDQEEQRLRRLARGAEYDLAAGDTERGRALLEHLLEMRRAGPERARVALRLGNVRYLTDDVTGAHALFGEALAHAGSDDRLRVEAQQALAFTAMLGGEIPSALGHAHAALALARRLADPRMLALAECRVGLNEFLSGYGFDRGRFERAAEAPDQLDEMPFEWLPAYTHAGVATMADDLDTARSLYERLAHVAAVHGDERATPTLLFATSELECRAGNWARATQLAIEAVERSRQVGLGTLRAWALYAQALVQAHIGMVDAARAAATEGLSVAQAAGAIAQVTRIISTLGFLELSLGNPAAANSHLGPLSALIATVGLAEPGVVRFMPNQIEALIALGDLDDATRLLTVFQQRARELDRISARAAAARCQAMLHAARSDFEAARASAAEALAQHARLHEPFELGRTLLAQGIIERRAKRRAAAREALTKALELFDSLGAALWAEKAAAELARIPGRTPPSSELSESERRVAYLAAEGLSNKEIAARLFVTVRTVEAHLSKTYAKLGVRSRTGLAGKVGVPTDV